MWPSMRNARPPNIFFSVSPSTSARSGRTREARASSKARRCSGVAKLRSSLGRFQVAADAEEAARGSGGPVAKEGDAQRQVAGQVHADRIGRLVDIRAAVLELELAHGIVLDHGATLRMTMTGCGFCPAGISELVETNSTTSCLPAGTTVDKARSRWPAALPGVATASTSVLNAFMIRLLCSSSSVAGGKGQATVPGRGPVPWRLTTFHRSPRSTQTSVSMKTPLQSWSPTDASCRIVE